ncbi:MAG: XdhC family protein [Proteobacteria bacterium]|nr:XdhC family protein [Pseudomonadota bacterium]
MNFYEYLASLEAAGTPFALVTILNASHNAPARTSFKMCVTEDKKIVGSIGGGGVEYKMRNEALEMLRTHEPIRICHEDFNDKDGVGCGGNADILIETIIPRPTLVIFGGGHIGTALTRYANDVGFNVTIYDDRPDYSTIEGHPGAMHGICAPYEDIPKTPFPKNAYFVIVTHQHTGDRACLEGILRRPELEPRYVGCIGSSVKLSHIFKAMMEEGIAREDLAKVHAPIGIDTGGNSATEVAISICAQLTAVAHNKVLADAMSAKKHPLNAIDNG